MASSPRDVVRMHRMRRVRPTQGERASAGPPNDPGSPDRGRGRRHRREAAAPDPGQWTPEPTEPGRKDRAARAACSGSVPRTPCPCGLSAVHAPVGQQPYLQPSWDERAPSRPTYQRPSSLPQSPRGFASSSSRSFRKGRLHSSLYPSGGFRQPRKRRSAAGVPSVSTRLANPRARRGAKRRPFSGHSPR